MNVLGPGFFPLHQLPGAGLAAADLPPGAAPGRNLLKFGLRPASHAGLDAREVRQMRLLICTSAVITELLFIVIEMAVPPACSRCVSGPAKGWR